MNDSEAREMARGLVRGSIIEDAASQFIAQVLKEAHDSRIKPLRDRIEELEAKLFSCATDLDIYMSAHASLEAKLAQQDDLVQAAVAAALREAATLCANVSTADLKANNPTYEEGYSNGAGVCHYEILALITQDAQDALDRAIAAAIGKGGE